MTQAAAGSSSLLVPAPFHQNDRPAAGLHAGLKPLVADALLATMGARLRARGPLLGPCDSPAHGEQGEHGDKDEGDDQTCHDLRSPKRRGQRKSYGQTLKRASAQMLFSSTALYPAPLGDPAAGARYRCAAPGYISA